VAVNCGDDGAGPDDDRDERILWVFQAGAEIHYGSPALSPDEQVVYFGTSAGGLQQPATGNKFFAVSVASGDELWRYPLGMGEVRSTPAVGPDGSITFMVQERNTAGLVVHDFVYRLSSSGQLLWTHDINPVPMGMEVGQSAPAIAADGTVYVSGDALYAIGADGTLKWTQFGPADEDLRNSPVIGPAGTVYFVFHNIPLTALDPDDGSIVWSLELGVNDHVFASPAIGEDGTIYVATNPGIVYAVSAEGVLQWTFDTRNIGYECTMRSSPAVGADGSIYLGTNSGNPVSVFLALNDNGTLKWLFEPSDLPPDVPSSHFDIYSSPAIGSDGTVYFGQEFGRIYALDPVTGGMRWMVEIQSGVTWSSPVLTAQGTLFINDLAGNVYAVKTESNGLDSQAAWPKFRHDNRNTGSGPS